MRKRLGLHVPLVLLLGCTVASAQTQDFTDWVFKRLEIATQEAAANGAAGMTKQVETPAVAGSSTAVVDQSGAPDLIGLALQFFNLGQGSDTTPMSITVSAFAIRNALLGNNPTRPEVYAAGRNWRRFSATVGRESEDAASGQPAAQLVGVKVLAWDQRDPTIPSNVERLQKAIEASKSGQGVAQALDALQILIATRLAPRFREDDPFTFMEEHLGAEKHAETLAELTPEDLAEVDLLLVERLAPAMQVAVDEQRALVQHLKQAPQLAFSYQARLRDEDGDDEHAWQGIFDYGVAERMNISVNAGMSVIDRPLLDRETVGRLAAEAQFRFGDEPSDLAGLLRANTPLTIGVSVAGAWHGDRDDIFKAQVKLKVPLPRPFEGVSLPISITLANRTELIDESDVRGQVGFTVDFSKLQRALRLDAR
jgi:hypothetical protein